MRDRQYFLPVFIVAVVLVIIIFILGKVGALSLISGGVQSAFFSVSQLFYHTDNAKVVQIQKENRLLQEEIAQMQQIVADNKALRDQFQTPSPASKSLFPARVVGMPGVIPNISFPETLIISLGKSNALQKGNAVVANNSLIGLVQVVSQNYAEVILTTNKASSFSVKDSNTGAIGVAKGQGSGEILMDNVQLSDVLHVGDLVVSLGSQNISGKGIMPDLVLGKIVSVEKNPSNLFQSARVMPLVQFDRLSIVFVSQ